MIPSPLPPPGWYDDPAGSPQERYWEGTRWTQNLRDRPETIPGVTSASPAAERVAAPQPAPQVSRGQVGPSQFRPKPTQGQPPQGQPTQGQPIPTPPGMVATLIRTTEDGVPLASFGVRALATIIDTILFAIIGGLVGWPYLVRVWRAFQEMLAWSMDNPGQTSIPVADFDYITPFTVVQFITLGVSFVAQVFLVRLLGGTLGQLVMGLRVVPAEKGRVARVSWKTSLLRSATWLAVMAASQVALFPVVISYFRPLWHPRLKTWHDSIADTQVVATRGDLAEAVLGAK